MPSLQKKHIFYFIVRNLVLYLLLIGVTYRSISYTKHSAETSYLPYVFDTIFYVWATIHNTLIFERLLLKRKYILYVVFLLAGLVSLAFLQRTILKPMAGKAEDWSAALLGYFIYTIIGIVCYLAFKYVMERKAFYQVKLMQRDIELQQLRAHLNPHFLFNALNNIYSYTLQQNRYGGELILKLSELMRFILDCSEKEHISLQDELGFIHNYIVFEKERLGERCSIHLNIREDDPGRRIAPLILFPFIENACKYGADTIQRTRIDITIENAPGVLKMAVKNSIVNRPSISTKTGLQNAVRRLELLYPDKHEVLITTDDNRFSVELILQYEED